MSSDAPPNKILRADPEHGGIRIATMLTITFGLLGVFILIRALMDWYAQGSLLHEFATVISCVVAVPAALAAGWLVERYLKKTWSSGQEFELGPEKLRFEGGQKEDDTRDERTLEFDKRINLTRWYTKLKDYPKAGRERLVSDNNLCVACQMQQDDERIIAFTYSSPEKAQAWIKDHATDEPFQEISLADLYSNTGKRRWNAGTRPEVSAERLAGPNGRYWIAERRRWKEGLELTPEDFDTLMNYIEEKRVSDFD